jgi:peptidoglycan/xylan/chitin deacetylase (PgdA/CDA1 family)
MPSYGVIRAGLEALYFSGAHHVLGTMFGGAGAILTMHHVRPSRGDSFQPNRILEIEAGFLDSVLGHFRRRGVDIVTMDEVRRRLLERDFDRKFAALTFDDAYLDNLEYALPVLKKHSAPFALYVATSFPDRLGELWWVSLERVIAKTGRVIIEMDGATRYFDVPDTEAKLSAFNEIYWWLRSLDSEEKLRKIVQDLCARYGVDPKGACRDFCMDWKAIAKMAADPLCTIGAHTINHPILRKWSAEKVRMEMQYSMKVIEDALGKKPEHFAYPFGDATAADVREFKIAEEAGFKTAVTTRPDVLRSEHREQLMALPRISLNGHFQAVRYVDVLMSGVPFALQRVLGKKAA